MKSKPTTFVSSAPLKPQKNKVSKKQNKKTKLNAIVKNNLLKNDESSGASRYTLPHQAASNSPSNVLLSVKNKKKKHRKSEDGNPASLKSTSIISVNENSAVTDAVPSFGGLSTSKKKNRRKSEPHISVDGRTSSLNNAISGRSPLMKNKEKFGKSKSIAPNEDVNSAMRSSSISGYVNGGSGGSPKKGKKQRNKKKRKIDGNAESEALNETVPKTTGKPANQSFSENSRKDAAQNLKKILEYKGKVGDSPNPSLGSLVAKRESGMSEDTKLFSKGKQKREKFKNSKNSSLREKMLSRLSAARFRFINEELYTWDGQDSPEVFTSDPQSFKAYHSGFKQQTKLWPINPIDVIIKSIKNVPDFEKKVIADFGCGEAKLALELASNKVYSFDLVAINDRVTVCDNANTKLFSGSVDVAVHCLSLMSSNISGYIKEANRVLRIGGLLKIAEVESRFEDVDKFAENVCKFNFKLIKKDLSHNLFYFMDFEKIADIGVARKRKLPVLTLLPCLYKKR